MEVAALVAAIILIALAIDILRLPPFPDPTVDQEIEIVLGKQKHADYGRMLWLYGMAPRASHLRFLAFLFLVAGAVLLARAFDLI